MTSNHAEPTRNGPPSGVRVTRGRKADNGLLCKRIALDPNGGPVSDGSPCRMWAGTATRVEITCGASGLAELISDLDSSEALILGDHVAEQEEIRLVKNKEADPDQGLYGRTLETFRFRRGEPAAMLLDFDKKGMPDSIAKRLDVAGGFEGAVARLLPDLGTYARVIRASTSAGIHNEETGEHFPSSGGMHLYLIARDGADIPRFLRSLQARAWLAGLGWIMVAGRGSLLVRSIVDITVGSPERLVFEGPPMVVPPLAQDEAARTPVAHDGELIDTHAAFPPLTDDEKARYLRLIDAAKDEARPAAEQAIEIAVKALARKRSITVDSARAAIKSSIEGNLLSLDSVQFDDDAIGVVQVSDILADPKRYHGETLADPVEGRSYGLGKCKLYHNGGGSVVINSFAHGGGIYTLGHSSEFITSRIEEAGENAPQVLGDLIPFASDLDAATRERLRDAAAKAGKVSKRAVNEMLKTSLAAAQREERERRAQNAPNDEGRPEGSRQAICLVSGQRPALLRRTQNILRKPENVGAGSILARGPTQVALRFATDPVKLRAGSAEIELPTGSAYLTAAKPEHLQAKLDRLISFRRLDPKGDEHLVDCPGDLARYVLANATFLPVTSISRTPLIRSDGSVIERPGYDVPTGIYYAPDIDFKPVATSPTQKDAARMLEVLKHPFRGFPFVTETDRDAVIAEVLTIMTRHLAPRVPAFVHNAVEAGSGKTKLFETVSTIALGTKVSMLNAEVLGDEAEFRKLMTTLTLSAAPFAVFDNAPRGETLTSPGLANFLTASIYSDRRLGVNEEVNAPTTTTIGITGNAIEIAGDLTRRMLRIDLDARCERPETRDFDFDCETEALDNRPDLISAALTILKAHALAGWPKVEGRAPLGSFEDWDRLVAGAVFFAGGTDIVELMNKTRQTDPERDGLAEVLVMMKAIGAEPGNAMKAIEVIIAARRNSESVNADDVDEERMALLIRLGKEGKPDPRRFGRFLKKNAGRVVQKMRLADDFDSHDKIHRYYVEDVEKHPDEPAGFAGKAGLVPNDRMAGENKANSVYLNNNTRSKAKRTPHHPQTPQAGITPSSDYWVEGEL